METWTQLSPEGRIAFAAGVIDAFAMVGFSCPGPVTVAEVTEGLRMKWLSNVVMRRRFTPAFMYALGERGCRFTDPARTGWLNQQIDARGTGDDHTAPGHGLLSETWKYAMNELSGALAS